MIGQVPLAYCWLVSRLATLLVGWVWNPPLSGVWTLTARGPQRHVEGSEGFGQNKYSFDCGDKGQFFWLGWWYTTMIGSLNVNLSWKNGYWSDFYILFCELKHRDGRESDLYYSLNKTSRKKKSACSVLPHLNIWELGTYILKCHPTRKGLFKIYNCYTS